MKQAKLRHSATRILTALFGAVILTGCLQNAASPPVSAGGRSSALAPPGAPPGTCWGKIDTPAVVETVTEKILVTPAKTNSDGSIATLPVFRQESRQQIVTPRQDRWFETPCPPDFTVEFVSTLQRALSARGLYAGPVSGNMDAATRSAVLAVQKAKGLPSDVLSIETARELGIVAVARAQ